PRTITTAVPNEIPKVRTRARPAACAAGLGASTRSPCVRRTAATTRRTAGTTTSGSAARRGRIELQVLDSESDQSRELRAKQMKTRAIAIGCFVGLLMLATAPGSPAGAADQPARGGPDIQSAQTEAYNGPKARSAAGEL